MGICINMSYSFICNAPALHFPIWSSRSFSPGLTLCHARALPWERTFYALYTVSGTNWNQYSINKRSAQTPHLFSDIAER